MKPSINILKLENVPIIEQLRIEEGLLRTDSSNWFIFNSGSPIAIVMGISGDPTEMLNRSLVEIDQVPVIQRFSGGGTVVVDPDTLFTTFIFQREIHPFNPYPKEILHWVGDFFKRALPLQDFAVQGNDFALGEKKIGGNAQYIRKDRWLHHTTFLWDFDPKNMDYLLHPPTEPAYRKGRSHMEFLTKIRPILSKDAFIEPVLSQLKKEFIVEIRDTLPPFPQHRTSTKEKIADSIYNK